MRLRTLSFGWLVVASAGPHGAGCIESNRYIGDGQNVADSPSLAGSSATGRAAAVGGSAIESSVAPGGSSSGVGAKAKSEVSGIAGAANIGGVTSNAGTAGNGGAVGVGGVIGVAGAAGIGAVGGIAGATTAPSPCGIFEGDWTVDPIVTSSAVEVDGSTPSNLPNVGQQLTPIGLHVANMDNQCVVEMLPEWSRSTSVTLSGSNGQLTHTATARQTELFTKCGEVDWYVNQVTLSNLGSRHFQLRADWTFPGESQATRSASVTIEGTMQSGLPTPDLTGYRSIDGDRTWCQLDPVPPVLSPLLPWEDINVESSVPASDILDRLVSLESNEPVIVSWMTPVPSFEPGQVKTGKILDWDQVMGRTMRVQDPLVIARKVDYAFETVQLSKGFLANDLQNLTTQGTRSLAYVNGLPALRMVGAACSETVYAAGRLDVSDPDSKGVVVAVHNSQPTGDPALSIKIFSRTSGTVIDAVLFELFSTPELSHYYASVGVEETEVGVQVSATGSCAAGRGAPDISVISIVATDVSSWSSVPL